MEGHEKDFLGQMDARVTRWLHTPDPDSESDNQIESDSFFDGWLLRRMAHNELFDVGGVLVDESLLDVRFACVPERCSPKVERGKFKSCCADLTVYLTKRERKRLEKHRKPLAKYMLEREPRLEKRIKGKKKKKKKEFWLDGDGDALTRPKKRCVFSLIDSEGRIRCHLHNYAAEKGLEQTDIQPVTCRLFPLILVDLEEGRVLVTALNKENYKAWGGKHPKYFPCLSDPELPPVIKTMGLTLDWLFGEGFAIKLLQAGALHRQEKADADKADKADVEKASTAEVVGD